MRVAHSNIGGDQISKCKPISGVTFPPNGQVWLFYKGAYLKQWYGIRRFHRRDPHYWEDHQETVYPTDGQRMRDPKPLNRRRPREYQIQDLTFRKQCARGTAPNGKDWGNATSVICVSR